MSGYSLSRSSWAYKFVFGLHDTWHMEGFPEPRNNRISLGLYAGMFLFMVFMRPMAFLIMTLFEVMLHILSFLVDGSYCRGRFPMELEIIKLEPWPRIFGHRLSPWILLSIGVISYHCAYADFQGAAVFLAFFAGTTFVFLSIQPGDKSLAMELTEATEPLIDEKLHLAYYREPKRFPALYLVG